MRSFVTQIQISTTRRLGEVFFPRLPIFLECLISTGGYTMSFHLLAIKRDERVEEGVQIEITINRFPSWLIEGPRHEIETVYRHPVPFQIHLCYRQTQVRRRRKLISLSINIQCTRISISQCFNL